MNPNDFAKERVTFRRSESSIAILLPDTKDASLLANSLERSGFCIHHALNTVSIYGPLDFNALEAHITANLDTIIDEERMRRARTELNSREIAAILAGLRMLQDNRPLRTTKSNRCYFTNNRKEADLYHDILTNGGEFEPLDDFEIDELAERLNFREVTLAEQPEPKPTFVDNTELKKRALAHHLGLKDINEVDNTRKNFFRAPIKSPVCTVVAEYRVLLPDEMDSELDHRLTQFAYAALNHTMHKHFDMETWKKEQAARPNVWLAEFNGVEYTVLVSDILYPGETCSVHSEFDIYIYRTG